MSRAAGQDAPRDRAEAQRPRVAIVGGGLAGLAAAVALADANLNIELFESRRRLGGRASSFRDPATDELVDHCQHVSMGCCTNLTDFCRRAGISDCFRTERVLHFIGPDGKQYDFGASPWLPAPWHLAPAFWRLKYLSPRARRQIGRAMLHLMSMSSEDRSNGITMGQWLRREGQSSEAIDNFWSVVLTSALSETVERASLAASRKVFVDGFLASRSAYHMQVPSVPLGEIYGDRLQRWLEKRGVQVRLSTPVRRVLGSHNRVQGILLMDGQGGEQPREFEFVVAALPWRTAELFDAKMAAALPWLGAVRSMDSAPITGVHLWYDRPIMQLPHAALIGRLSQWVFARGTSQADASATARHYYQVVISASRQLAAVDRQETINTVTRELSEIWPEARAAKLLHSRMVTEPEAVFSPTAQNEALRPEQQTPIEGLLVAGDWTATGWPATMEGAVRSGYQAAERILQRVGAPRSIVVPDLPRSWLAKMLIKS